jgi:hypothetical protein
MTKTRRSGLGSLRCQLGVAAVLASCVLFASSASAEPGVIAARQAEVFDGPSESARVVSVLGRGVSVLVYDAESVAFGVLHVPGWLAIRLPDSGGVGYVRAAAVELATATLGEETATPGEETASPGEETASPGEETASPGEETAPPVAPPVRQPFDPATDRPVPWPSVASGAVGEPVMAGRLMPLRPARFALGMGSGGAWLREQSADQNRIGSSGPLLNFTARLTIKDLFTMSVAGGFVFPTDNASFNEVVVSEQGGDLTIADSSLTMVRGSLAVGVRTPFLALGRTGEGWVAGALYADYGWTAVAATRSISDCVDCRSDDLHLPGGTFWRVGLDLVHSPRLGYGLTVAYQRYLAGAGLTQEIYVGVDMWLH